MDANRISRLKDRYQAETWGSDTEPEEVQRDLDVKGDLLPGWSVLDSSRESLEDGADSRTILLRSADEEQEQILRVDVHRYADPQAARDGLVFFLDQFEGPVVERLEGAEALGDAAFSVPGGYLTLFVQGSVVVRVSNAGRDLVSSAEPARTLSEALRR